ncbi:MAG: carboxypeptidase-like regulatory domain-containing protein [Clostridiales bacterium]|nr:carboxypeptidase-like regulatory domain-containing protein [Clostridiales bacterium]HBM79832.1 hypothetical protein [Clostridiaceae bacterium]
MKFVSKILLVALAIGICAGFSGCTKNTDSTNIQLENDEEGKILITVKDKSSQKPVSDANVIIVGMDDYFKTNDKGQSPEISLKINKDLYKKYGDTLYKKAPSGSATVIVSKDGYKDYILFNKPVYAGYSANNVNIQMSKSTDKDKGKYTIDVQYPHDLWVKELVAHCKEINGENAGNGEYKIGVGVKDANSKSLEGAFVTIPELGIKTKTDKSGKAVLKPGIIGNMADEYPVKKDLNEYTVVIYKDGYVPSVVFSVSAGKNSDGKVDIKLKGSKDPANENCSVTYQPFDSEWISKVISAVKESYKE